MRKKILLLLAFLATACSTLPKEKKLVWQKPEGSNVSGYRVYLAQPEGKKGKLLLELKDSQITEIPLKTVLQHLNEQSKNTVYVVAYDSSGYESFPSETVCLGNACPPKTK